MPVFAGPLFAAALLLGIAGMVKVTRPAGTRVALRSAGLPSRAWMARLLGATEVVIAAAALAFGGPIPALFVCAAYLGFAWFAWVLMRRSRGKASCGCFGASDAPVSRIHVAVDLVMAALVAGAVVAPVDGLIDTLADLTLTNALFLALTALLTWMVYVLLTALPAALDAAKPGATA